MASLRQSSLAPATKRARLSIEIKLPSSVAKDSFTTKLDSLRSILKPPKEWKASRAILVSRWWNVALNLELLLLTETTSKLSTLAS